MDWLGYLVGGVILAFLAVQVLPLLRARHMRGQPAPDLAGVTVESQRQLPRLLVYFWSPTCGMCRTMTPVIDALARERHDIVKVNVQEAAPLARRFGVMATPALVLVRDGRIEQILLGARSEAQIRTLLA
jgi:thioredoxin 1